MEGGFPGYYQRTRWITEVLASRGCRRQRDRFWLSYTLRSQRDLDLGPNIPVGLDHHEFDLSTAFCAM